MKKNWIGPIVLVGVSMAAGSLLSQVWEQVHGQPFGFPAEVPLVAPQVVVRQSAELPKWFVDFASLPPQSGRPEIRVITVVDTETKRIAMYHLNTMDGNLHWLSTRNIQPDLMIDQHNATSPLPSELMLEMQRLGQIRQNRQ